MKVVQITKQSIKEAISILKHGGTVIYPTETAYALGCDATNKSAQKRIFKIKNRPTEKNLPMICATKKMASDFFKFGKMEKKLAKKYWPGPLSIILKLRITRPQRLSVAMAGAANYELRIKKKQEIPVRISSNKVARALSRGLRRPIISTSANISGKKTLYDIKEIIREFSNKKNQPASNSNRGEPDLILDAGKLPCQKPSTIIKIVDEKIIILRQGKVRI